MFVGLLVGFGLSCYFVNEKFYEWEQYKKRLMKYIMKIMVMQEIVKMLKKEHNINDFDNTKKLNKFLEENKIILI